MIVIFHPVKQSKRKPTGKNSNKKTFCISLVSKTGQSFYVHVPVTEFEFLKRASDVEETLII